MYKMTWLSKNFERFGATARESSRILAERASNTALRTGIAITSRFHAAEPDIITQKANMVAEAIVGSLKQNGDNLRFILGASDNQELACTVPATEIDQNTLSRILTPLTSNLTNSRGTLNQSAILINNRELLNALVRILTNQVDGVNPDFKRAVQDTLIELVERSSKQSGFFSSGCPEEIKDLIKYGYLHENPQDPKAKLQRAISVSKLINTIAKNARGKDLNTAVTQYLNKIPSYFFGEVGEALVPLIRTEIEEVLSNTNALLNDSVLKTLHPATVKDLGHYLAELVEGQITPRLRNSVLVKAGMRIISAFEDNDRVLGNDTSMGLSQARKKFQELLISRFREQIERKTKICHIERLRQKMIQAKESGLKISVPNPDGRGYSVKVVTSEDILATDRLLLKLEEENHRINKTNSEELIAFGDALNVIYLEGESGSTQKGIKSLFFNRLLGSDSNYENNQFIEGFFGVDDINDFDIDYSLLNTDEYGQDFTGLQAMVLNYARAAYREDQRRISEIEDILSGNQSEIDSFNNTYYKPLVSVTEQVLKANEIDSLYSSLSAFTGNTELRDGLKQAQENLLKAYKGVLDNIIVRGSDGFFVIDKEQVQIFFEILRSRDISPKAMELSLEQIVKDLNSVENNQGYSPSSLVKTDNQSFQDFMSLINQHKLYEVENPKESDLLLSKLEEIYNRRNDAVRALGLVVQNRYSTNSYSTNSSDTLSKLKEVLSPYNITLLDDFDLGSLANNISRGQSLNKLRLSLIKEQELLKEHTEQSNDEDVKNYNTRWNIRIQSSLSGIISKGFGDSLRSLGIENEQAQAIISSCGSILQTMTDDDQTSIVLIIKELVKQILVCMNSISEGVQRGS